MAKDRKTSRAQVGLRVSEEMRQRLGDAATSNGRSINSEIVSRLDRSFETEDRLGGPGLSALVETIATVMKSTGELAGFYETGKLTNRGEWLALPYAFDQATRAAKAILKHHKPPGKIVVPKPNVVEVIGVRGTTVDPKESVARMHQKFAELGPLTAAGELRKKEQDNE